MRQKSVFSRVIICVLLVILLFSFSTYPVAAYTAIRYVTISNVTDNSFVVSWTTGINSNGSVEYWITSPPGTTVSDGVTSTTSHYVTISGILPNHTYNFRVTSGDETDPTIYQVTTGPSLLPNTGNTLFGSIYLANGTTPVPNAIVYLQLQDANSSGSPGSSQWLSGRADGTGAWNCYLGNARTSDFQNWFIFTPGGDNVRIIGQGGSNGTRGINPIWIIQIPSGNPGEVNVSLTDAPTDVMVSSFTGKDRLSNVQLDWKTVTEVGLVGFNVYRSDSLDGAKLMLNSEVIPAQNAGQMIGATYHFNEAVQQGQHYYYWLELVMTGANQIIDPVVIDTDYWNILPVIHLGS